MDGDGRAAAQREVDAAFAAAAVAALRPGGAPPPGVFAPQTDPLTLQLHAALKRVEDLDAQIPKLAAEAEAARAACARAEVQAFFARINVQTLLKDALQAYNCWNAETPAQRDGPHCGCTPCHVAGRVVSDEDYPRPPQCVFKPAFEALLRELGITCSFSFGLHDESARGSMYLQALGEDHEQDCSPEDVHLVAKHDWVFVQFGRRVWAATSVEDEALQKMQRLLTRLYQEQDRDGSTAAAME